MCILKLNLNKVDGDDVIGPLVSAVAIGLGHGRIVLGCWVAIVSGLTLARSLSVRTPL